MILIIIISSISPFFSCMSATVEPFVFISPDAQWVTYDRYNSITFANKLANWTQQNQNKHDNFLVSPVMHRGRGLAR